MALWEFGVAQEWQACFRPEPETHALVFGMQTYVERERTAELLNCRLQLFVRMYLPPEPCSPREAGALR